MAAELTPVHAAALAFAEAGCSVVPARTDGSKAPLGDWKKYQTQRPDRHQLDAWFAAGHQGVGIVCGAVSGGLVMVELEGRALAGNMLARAGEVALAAGDADLWRRITTGYVEATPSGGAHILYRITDAPCPGNQKLARRPAAEAPGVDVLAETRGEGGYVIVAPSGGSTHPTGRSWTKFTGSPATIPDLTIDEHTRVCSILRALDEMPQAATATEPAIIAPRAPGELAPGDDYNQRTSWAELLAPYGWKLVRHRGDICDWRRPGKNDGISATTGYGEHDLLYVFSTSTLFDSEKSYNRFAAYALLEHGGDYSAAARQLRHDGYGTGRNDQLEPLRPFTPQTSSGAEELHASALQATAERPADPAPEEHTSWWPRDLHPTLTGERKGQEPTVLARRDGHRLFYPGKMNGLMGESESGKTWVAMLAAKQELDIGNTVLFLDFEDSEEGVVERMLAFGIPADVLETRFIYVTPDEILESAARHDLEQTLNNHRPSLVVLDGYNNAMGLLGFDFYSNPDVISFNRTLLRPIAKSGPALVTIDHVVKAKEGRGLNPIGAQAKRSEVDGCLLVVEPLKPFGKGLDGKLKLTVSKDRIGHIRGASEGGRTAGFVDFRSKESGVTLKIEAPLTTEERANKAPFRPTAYMERISAFLLDVKEASGNNIEKGVSGGKDHIRTALQKLVEEGYVSRGSGPNRAVIYGFIKPFVNDLQAWNPDGGGDRDE